MKGLCKGRQEEVWLGLAGVLRLGISSALADFQPRRITRCASDRCKAAEAAQKKSAKPPTGPRPHGALPPA